MCLLVEQQQQQPIYQHQARVHDDESWEPYDAATSAAIAEAIGADPNGKLRLEGSPFELRFGTSAVSSKWLAYSKNPPATGILQVNVANDNSRVVRCAPKGYTPSPLAEELARLRNEMRRSVSKAPAAAPAVPSMHVGDPEVQTLIQKVCSKPSTQYLDARAAIQRVLGRRITQSEKEQVTAALGGEEAGKFAAAQQQAATAAAGAALVACGAAAAARAVHAAAESVVVTLTTPGPGQSMGGNVVKRELRPQ